MIHKFSLTEKLADRGQEGGSSIQNTRPDETNVHAERQNNNIDGLINNLKDSGATICGIGASTKGNVLLQYCNFSSDQISFIGDVNEEKFGCFTPGTLIPIISEEEVLNLKPDYLLILPWHFKDHFIQRFRDYRLSGGKIIFPLPSIQII